MIAERTTWQETIDALRWSEDDLVTNPFGDDVWLKPLVVNGRRIGITDCCFADDPCSRHEDLAAIEQVGGGDDA